MRVQKRFNLTPTTQNLAPHKHHNTKPYKRTV